MKIIEFSNCKLADKGMIAISKFILDVQVHEIQLSNNKIGKYFVSKVLNEKRAALNLVKQIKRSGIASYIINKQG